MKTQQNEQFELTKLLQILTRKKWLILSCMIGVLLSVIVFNHFYRPIYKAQTVIVFEEQQGSASLINHFKNSISRSFITNKIEKIESLSLAEEVVKALPPKIINTFPLPKNPAPDFSKEEYIVYQIHKRISAVPVHNSEVIKIQVEAYSPLAAKVIANTVTEVFQQRNLKFRKEKTTNARKIIEDQLINFKSQLDGAEIALKKFKEQNKVTVINREAEEIYKRITEAEIVYNSTKADLDAARKRLLFIQNKLVQEREDLVPTITKITSSWAKKLKQQLVDLEVQYTTLKLQDYSEDHPKLKELKNKIEQTKNNLKTESLKIAAGENIVDPISQIQKFMEESISLEIEIETYAAQERTLRSVINKYKSNLNTLPKKELRLAQLLRDKEVNEKIYTMLLQKKEETKIAEAEKAGNIMIIDAAKAPSKPSKPRKELNLILGIILGFVMGIGLAFLSELFDNSIKTLEEAEQITGLSVLGTIPKITTIIKSAKLKSIKKIQGKKISNMVSKLITVYNHHSPESEAFRSAKSNILFSEYNSNIKSILVTSTNPNEGKSLITANLAIAAAQSGLKTLLIDADLRKPVLHILFQKEKEPGLTDFLVSPKSTISNTNINRLDLLTCGSIPFDPSEILASKLIRNFIRELRNQYDAIFIDTPPINLFNDAGLLSSIVDGSVLVINAGTSLVKEVLKAEKILSKARSNTIGVVVNQIESKKYYSKYFDYYFSDNNNGKKRANKYEKHYSHTLIAGR